MHADEAAGLLIHPSTYADEALVHRAAKVLRATSPVHRVEHPTGAVWVLTRQSEIRAVSAQPDRFRNMPRPILQPQVPPPPAPGSPSPRPIRSLVQMDGDDHRAHREITFSLFTPRALETWQPAIEEAARHAVDRMAEADGACDFAADVAAEMPLAVIGSMLGVPVDERAHLHRLTQEMFGAYDPDLGRERRSAGEVVVDFIDYFSRLLEARRAVPAEDLISVIATATVDGRRLDLHDAASYCTMLVTAGHDTTAAAIAGGLLALLEHPDQFARLRGERGELVTSTTEEIVRWVTPVKHFMRNPVEPVELAGQQLVPGDALFMSYASANRDETMFDDADRFDLTRRPNRHLAFGFGAHHCLGYVLARREITALVTELLERTTDIELAGRPEWSEAMFVGGLKRLPITYGMSS